MSAGSKPGERRGGRKVGTPNRKTDAVTHAAKVAAAPSPTWDGKLTATELARGYTTLAVKALAKVVANSQSDSAIVAASTALLAQGWGKPATNEAIPPAKTPLAEDDHMEVPPLAIKPNGNGHAVSLSDFRKAG